MLKSTTKKSKAKVLREWGFVVREKGYDNVYYIEYSGTRKDAREKKKSFKKMYWITTGEIKKVEFPMP